MTSGYGLNGGVGRCYPFFKALERCLRESVDPRQCALYHEDYFECLHRTKELAQRREFERRRRMAKKNKAKQQQPEQHSQPQPEPQPEQNNAKRLHVEGEG
jgi:NADH dehydrogenase (ubiquinone) Fe-S protein 5